MRPPLLLDGPMNYPTGEQILIYDRVSGGMEPVSVVIGIYPQGMPSTDEWLEPGIMIAPGPIYVGAEELHSEFADVRFIERGVEGSERALTDNDGVELT